MVNLEIPWINIMSKMDLVTSNTEDPASGRNGIRARKDISRQAVEQSFLALTVDSLHFSYLEPDPLLLVAAPGSRQEKTERNSKFHSLNRAIVQLVRTPSWLWE